MLNWKCCAVLVVLSLTTVGPAGAVQICSSEEPSPEIVLTDPDVTLTWAGSFLCADAPEFDAWEITVTVTNDASSAEPVRVDSIQMIRVTPRNAAGSVTSTDGLPTAVLMPGSSADFRLRGSYQLAETDEGPKANLHFLAHGEGTTSGRAFALGINVHVRAPGTVEE
jgi:hypothetical protein